jgi:hypothetical protein
VTLSSRSKGARVIVAGRDPAALGAAYDDPDAESIAALAERMGPVDHVVSTASARPRGTLAELDRISLQRSFDTKVIGPTMMAKHFASQISPGASFVLFSGVHAIKAKVGYLGVAITNGAADSSPVRWRSSWSRSGSTRSRRASSTPARAIHWAKAAGPTTSHGSASPIPRAASAPHGMWPTPCCSL